MAANQPIIIKKKKGHGHGHHGGAWKVAYADFVTAMMAFFMVMWIMGLAPETKAQIQGYFNDPMGFTKNQPKTQINILPNMGMPKSKDHYQTQASEASIQEQKAKQVESELKSEIKGSGDKDIQALYNSMQTSMTPEGLQVDLIENSGAVFFESGKAVIRPAAMKLIRQMAPIFRRSKRPMLIDGHTDARPFGDKNYDNWNLSTDRALAMMKAFKAAGIPDSQFVAARGFSSTRLKDPKHPFSFINRRVTVLLPFTFTSHESIGSLPRDILQQEIQGVFKKPLDP
ncbi:MAG: OmpA family protein [Armatimonadetes bacterium]|nr:OmpA family protein [Armatimonadota bacterium]